jgi:hypothetical protein
MLTAFLVDYDRARMIHLILGFYFLVPFIKPIDFEAIDCFWMYDFPGWG